jgi:hypothetical protein
MNIRENLLKTIGDGIRQTGYKIIFVNGGQNPHYAYTIGLYEKFGFELVVAGGFTSIKDNESKFRAIYRALNSGADTNSVFNCESCDEMKLLQMHSSWSENMTLGVYTYYNIDSVRTLQIFPLNERLLDIPIMSEPFDEFNPIWKWLTIPWDRNTPKNSYVITNVEFLRGEPITEIMRFEDGYWEMFVDSKVPRDVRALPLGVMIGIDGSLEKAIELKIGDGLLRENKDDEWRDWE